MIWPDDYVNKIVIADCLDAMKNIPDNVIQMCVTSPPYWKLRDYKIEGQLGLEETPGEYVTKMVEIFHEVKRILKPDGVMFLNLGDSYVSNYNIKDENILKPKDLVGIPWRVAFALQKDGWYLRQDIIWAKPNSTPESITDRCTKAHEYIFLMSKSERYYFNLEAIQEPATGYDGRKDIVFKGGVKYNSFNEQPMLSRKHVRWKFKKLENDENLSPIRNRRSVWTIPIEPYPGIHFAPFPPKLASLCIMAGSKPGDIVIDPFGGSGTTALRANALGRNYVHIDLGYKKIAEERLAQKELFMAEKESCNG